MIVAICLLLMIGAFAKSAQVPLHTWLAGRDGGPDAGLRPDPRRHDGDRRRLPDRAHAPAVRAGADGGGHLGAGSAALTLFFAASVALVATDLKRIIAYSTISQIGYMILGVSVAAYSARACST